MMTAKEIQKETEKKYLTSLIKAFLSNKSSYLVKQANLTWLVGNGPYSFINIEAQAKIKEFSSYTK